MHQLDVSNIRKLYSFLFLDINFFFLFENLAYPYDLKKTAFSCKDLIEGFMQVSEHEQKSRPLDEVVKQE